jgi:1,4-alpha-glucan branching enzyme
VTTTNNTTAKPGIKSTDDAPGPGTDDLYYFARGEHERAYRFLGAHACLYAGVAGVSFAVWAPSAQQVSVVGDFNAWQSGRDVLQPQGTSGVHAGFVADVAPGMHYKYHITAGNGQVQPLKSDPYARETQLRPDTASMVPYHTEFQWQDSQWLEQRQYAALHAAPILIYELHAGSWRRTVQGDFLNYRELADQLIPYAKSLGFTHIQLMPISEFPFDGSWGYQPIGLFSPSRRFGSPDDLRYLVDQAHQHGIGVLIDWVPAHFPADAHGLIRFDGSCLYEHEDPRQGFHPDWNTMIFNFGRGEVISYLLSNAMYWLDEFHIDGLRVDAVASMLYLNYSREDGEWLPNQQGGVENLEAIHLLRLINERVHREFPGVLMVAEESTAWPGVTQMTSQGGLGFGFKWNMGWMNDTLRYIEREPVYRRFHHHEMTFGLMYAFSEQFILPLSHDEVVHGKRALLEKMPGDDWQKFANLRAYYAFMWAHPGKKLLFMGGEFAQRREWNHDQSLDWHLLEKSEPQHSLHRGMQKLITDMNSVLKTLPAFYENDAHSDGFEWIDSDSQDLSVFVFLRRTSNNNDRGNLVVSVSNMTPVVHQHYRIGVPQPGKYLEILNTDSGYYGGSDVGNMGKVESEAIPAHGRPWSITLCLPPLATLWLKHQ